MEKEADRVIRDYLSNVGQRLRGLPEDERSAILDNLKSHFYEALNSRCRGAEPTHEDISMVMAGMDPPEAFGSEFAQTPIGAQEPSILWLPILLLGVSAVGKLAVLLTKPGSPIFTMKIVAGIALSIALLYGVLRVKRWAYWLVVVGTPVSSALAFREFAMIGFGTTAINLAILLPVLASKDLFLARTNSGEVDDTRRIGGISGTGKALILSVFASGLVLLGIWLVPRYLAAHEIVQTAESMSNVGNVHFSGHFIDSYGGHELEGWMQGPSRFRIRVGGLWDESIDGQRSTRLQQRGGRSIAVTPRAEDTDTGMPLAVFRDRAVLRSVLKRLRPEINRLPVGRGPQGARYREYWIRASTGSTQLSVDAHTGLILSFTQFHKNKGPVMAIDHIEYGAIFPDSVFTLKIPTGAKVTDHTLHLRPGE